MDNVDERAILGLMPKAALPFQSIPKTELNTDAGGHEGIDTHLNHVAPSVQNGGDGHVNSDAQQRCAETAPFSEIDGHGTDDTQEAIAVDLTYSTEVAGQLQHDPHETVAGDLDLICDRLRELHRQRQDLHRAEKSLTLQIKAKCRRICGGDDLKQNKKEADQLYKAMFGAGGHEHAISVLMVSEPFIEARVVLGAKRKQTEKIMEQQAKLLPVSQWILETRGVGLGSLAAIVGECGNLSNYATVSKLWKRLGLAVLHGKRQRRVSGDEAIEHGYSPSRRAVMWNVGQTLFKGQSQRVDKETGEVIRPAGKYRLIYDREKARQLPRCEAMTEEMKKKSSTGKYSAKAHAHNRATRVMEKAFLRDLWKAWRQ